MIVTLNLNEEQLRQLVSLVATAGSRLGDTNIMLAATDILREIQKQVDDQATNDKT